MDQEWQRGVSRDSATVVGYGGDVKESIMAEKGATHGYPVHRDSYDPFLSADTITYVSSPRVYTSPLREHPNPFVIQHGMQSPPTQTNITPEPQAVPAVAEETRKKKKKGRKMHPFVKGVVVLTVGPLVMAGACVAAVGGFMYGTGQIIVGVGDILTGGPLKKTLKKAWKTRNEDC